MSDKILSNKLEGIHQAQIERLLHIDFRLCFLGTVGRGDLVSRFGIKEAAATRDIASYKEISPENLLYDSKAKTYTRSNTFTPIFGYDSNQALTALVYGFGDDFLGIRKSPIICETPAQLNKPSLEILSVLSRAIYQKKVVKITYRSLSSGETTREIIPFGLVDNGLRWHVRAYDRRRSRFTDFVLTRICNPTMIDGSIDEDEIIDCDIQWNRIVEMEIVPHPRLKYPRTIEEDYAMEDGVLRVNVRAAVAGYVLRRWNVDCTENHSMDGEENHLWLRNRAALYGVDNLVIAPGYTVSDAINID